MCSKMPVSWRELVDAIGCSARYRWGESGDMYMLRVPALSFASCSPMRRIGVALLSYYTALVERHHGTSTDIHPRSVSPLRLGWALADPSAAYWNSVFCQRFLRFSTDDRGAR